MAPRADAQTVEGPRVRPAWAPTASSSLRDVRTRMEGQYEVVERAVGELRAARRLATKTVPRGLTARVWAAHSDDAQRAEAHLARHANEAVIAQLLDRLWDEREALERALEKLLHGQSPEGASLPEKAAAVEGSDHFLYEQFDYSGWGRWLLAAVLTCYSMLVTVPLFVPLVGGAGGLLGLLALPVAWAILRLGGIPPQYSRVLVTSRRLVVDGREHLLEHLLGARVYRDRKRDILELEFTTGPERFAVRELPWGARRALNALGRINSGERRLDLPAPHQPVADPGEPATNPGAPPTTDPGEAHHG